MKQFNPQKLRAIREERDLTLADLATRLKVNASTVLRWEQGKAKPRPGHVRILCRSLRIPRNELFVPAETTT